MVDAQINVFNEICRKYLVQWHCLWNTLFCFLNYLSERQRDKGKTDLLPVVHFPNAYNSQGWPRPKLGAGNIWVSYKSGRDTTTWVVTCCLPGCTSAGSWNWRWSWDLVSDAGVSGSIPSAVPEACPFVRQCGCLEAWYAKFS